MQIALFPEWLLSSVPLSREQARWLNLLFSGALVIILVALSLDRVESLPHFCLIQRTLGIPCPGCGILHSLNGTFRCDFRQAWSANPAGLVLALGLMFQVCGSAVVLAGFPLSQQLEKFDLFLARAFGVGAVAVWIYRVSIKFA
jgi:hypothetical protein